MQRRASAFKPSPRLKRRRRKLQARQKSHRVINKCTYLSHSYLLRSTCGHLHMQEVKPPFPRGSCSNDCKKRPASCFQKKPAAAAPPPGPVRQAKTRTTGGRTPAAPLEGVAQGQQQDRACAAPKAKKPAPSSNTAKRAPTTDSNNVHSRAYHHTLSMCKRAGMPEEEAKQALPLPESIRSSAPGKQARMRSRPCWQVRPVSVRTPRLAREAEGATGMFCGGPRAWRGSHALFT